MRFLSTATLFVLALLFVQPSAALAQTRAPRILVVTPEFEGVMQTGGLAPAVAGISRGLRAEYGENNVEVIIPGYSNPQRTLSTRAERQIVVELNGQDTRFQVRKGELNGLSMTELHHVSQEGARFFNNPTVEGQKPYYNSQSSEWKAFGAFSKAVAQYAIENNFDLVISHDWTVGLVSTYLRYLTPGYKVKPTSLFMIHNMAYQGRFSKDLVPQLSLSWNDFKANGGFEYYDDLNFLKAGMVHSDYVLTVSANYAKEIQTARYGMGLDGVARELNANGRLGGILNGINVADWIPQDFSAENFSGKAEGKESLLSQFGLTPAGDQVPLVIMTSRLDSQKGLDYLLPALEQILSSRDIRLIVMGDGREDYRNRLQNMMKSFPGKMHYRAFSSELEKKVTRYADFFINAAWFEPSGLNQFYSLINGTIPIVAKVGGLMDSVVHNLNGLIFEIVQGMDGTGYNTEATAANIVSTLEHAFSNLYSEKGQLYEMRRRGMAMDNSWTSRVREKYRPLIDKLISVRENACIKAASK